MSRTHRARAPRPYPTRPTESSRHQHAQKTYPHSHVPPAFWLTEPESNTPHDTTPLSDGLDLSRTVPQRAISEFSKTGDRILLAADDTAFLARVAEGISDRTITCTPLRANTDSDRPEVRQRARGAGGCALVVTLQPSQSSIEVDIYRRWAGLLRPGAVLVVITTNPAGAGRFHNHLGAVITAARAAGLTYLQHIIAVCAHVEGDRLLVPTRIQHRRRTDDGVTLHVPVHHDLIALVRPARHERRH